jgi:Tfp pilus assembly protein FimV
LLAGAVLVGLLLALAAPVTALGGRPATHPAAVAAPATRAPATVYVVRPGDTLASIAVRMSHGHDAAGLAAALSSELGTAVLTPGERIVLP